MPNATGRPRDLIGDRAGCLGLPPLLHGIPNWSAEETMHRFHSRWAPAILATALLAGIAAPVSAGTLAGVVLGPTSHGLSGAVVTVTPAAGGTARQVVTGEGGEFRVADLAVGDYDVVGSITGFHPTTMSAVSISADGVTRISMTLASATFLDTIDIASASPLDSLEAAEIRESGARDLGEALARQPGVWKTRKGGIANDIVLRGFREENLTVLIDGARVAGACPNRMDPPAFHVDFAEVDRVELSPSAGRMAAQGSLGGLINVVTKKPGRDLDAEVTMVAGSWEMINPSATVSWGSGRFGVLGGLSHRSSAPFEDGSGRSLIEMANYTDAAGGVDAYSIDSGWTRLYFSPADEHELHLSYARQESSDVLYPGLMMDAAYDDTDRLTLGYRFEPADGGPLRGVRANFYATRVDHWMVDSLRVTAGSAPRGWSMGTNAETGTLGTSVEAELGSFVFGVEAYRRMWDAWTEMAGMNYMRQYSVPDVEVTAVGVSARWRRQISAATALELGGRFDWVETAADPDKASTDLYFAYHGVRDTSRSDAEPSLSARISHDLGAGLTVSAGVSRSTRPPDARERYFGLRRMGADWVGNPTLAPPRSTSAEASMTWSGAAGVLTASVWSDWVGDFITVYAAPRINMVPGVMNPEAQSYANVAARLRGVSIDGTIPLSSRLFVAGSAAWVRGTKDRDAALGLESDNLAEMPPLTGRLGVRWQSPRYFAELEGLGATEQDEVDGDLEETRTPAWGIVNFKVGVTSRHWRLMLLLENLFDRSYHEHLSYQRNPFRSGFTVFEPGRSFSATVGWRL
jgi:iron complex outermembrane receptor protein